MYKSKLFTSLSAAVLVAVLLTVTSLAQAAPKIRPGGSNPGTTTEAYVTDPFFIFANVGSSCLNTTDLCQYYSQYYDVGASASGDLDTYALAWAYWDLACQSGASANAGGEMFVVGKGLLELNRHGKHGSMHNIKFKAGMSGANLVWADAGTFAYALAVGEVYALGGVADIDRACSSVTGTQGGGDIQGRVLETCAAFGALGYSDGYGFAAGTGFASSFAGAGSYSLFAAGGWTEVWAANIERFEAVVAAGAYNFAGADANAQADIFVEAYISAYMDLYIRTCSSADITPPGAYVQLCADGEANAWAYAYTAAQAFAAAQASASAETYFTAIIPAVYQNLSGTEDLIDIGVYGMGGAQGNAATYCYVPTM